MRKQNNVKITSEVVEKPRVIMVCVCVCVCACACVHACVCMRVCVCDHYSIIYCSQFTDF